MTCIRSLAVAAALLHSVGADAIIVVDFEALDSFDNFATFYSGGFNNAGLQGPDLGIVLTGATTARSAGNTSLWTDEQFGELSAFVAGGFSDGFAFRFAPEVAMTVTVQVLSADFEIIGSASLVTDATGVAVDPVTGELFYEDWTTLGVEFDGLAHWVYIYEDYCCSPVLNVDDYTFGSATLIPLPPALWLFATALGAFPALRRYR